MGIESTQNINRNNAISRISTVINLIEKAEWDELYKIAENEDSNFKDVFVNEYNEIHKKYIYNNSLFVTIDNWPNKYLEDFMDKMGVRYSMFENYIII